MNATLTNEFDAKLDSKKRITLRGAKSDYYAVRMFSDGRVLLEPRVLVPPKSISEASLLMLDTASENFKKGIASEPIDLDKYL